MAWTLCAKSDVIDIFPISEDELLDSWSDMAEALIKQYYGEPYLGTTQAITGELQNGDGTQIMRVRYPPIQSVQAVRVNELLLTATDYASYPTHIVLLAQTFPDGTLNVSLDYTSGTTSIDYVTKITAASMIVAIINYKRRHGADSSLKWSSGEMKAGEESPNQDLGLMSHLYGIMKQILKRPRVRMR